MSYTIELELDETEKKKRLLGGQFQMIFVLLFAWLLMKAVTYFNSEIFPYSYLTWGGWDGVFAFWPIFAWGLLMAVLGSMASVPIVHPTKRFDDLKLGMVISFLAGIWEELAYRYVFIFYALLSLMFANWFVGAGLLWIFVAILAVGSAVLWLDKGSKGWAVLLTVITGWLGYLLYTYGSEITIIYWLNDLLRKLANFMTLGRMESVLFLPDWKFVFAALIANSWFRDGHKYQGFFGFVNSWYLGMVFLYATVTYGLYTAIVIHILYDVIIFFVRFVASHFDGSE